MVISPLLINEPPLQVLPSLAQKIGLNEAIIVQQVHYWLNPKFNKNYFEGRNWVWNTYEQWQQQFPFWWASQYGADIVVIVVTPAHPWETMYIFFLNEK